jgi:hypothetical protein
MSSLRTLTRRSTTAVALTAVVAGGTVLAAASPAGAAIPAGAVVCFEYPNGLPYTGPVNAQVLSNSGAWNNVAAAASATGCSSWQLVAGYPWRFQAFATGYRTIIQGASAPVTPTAPAMYNFGTWVVTASYF